MNVKNNKRRRASVKRIEDVFLEFLQTKDFNEITVSEICKAAEINRSTFYSNFIDIFDLADKIKEHLEQDVSSLYNIDAVNDFSDNEFLKLLYHIKENQLFYKTYFKLGYDSKHEINLYDLDLAEHYFGSKHIKYHIEFFKNGFNAIIKMWLDSGCKESPEEIDEVIKSEYRGRVLPKHL